MAATGLILGVFILAVISAIAGFLTKRKLLYGVALALGLMAILVSLVLALAISRM